MPFLPDLPTYTPPAWLARLITLALLALLAWLCASIYWVLAVPDAPALPAEEVMEPAQLLSALEQRHLFGKAAQSLVQEAGPAIAASAVSFDNLRLLGIIAATRPGQPAYALLARDGQSPQVIREGEDFEPGLRLSKVSPKEIEILGSGQSFKLSLPAFHQP